MKTRNTLIVAAAAATLFAGSQAMACPFCKERKTGLFIGQTALMGDGAARSWIDIDDKGKPTALGITFGSRALSNLPDGVKGGMPAEFLMALPTEAKAITPFDHIAVNWEPKGHEPKGIYDRPHFDVHFYAVSPSERSKFKVDGKHLAHARLQPLAKIIPAGYVNPPGVDMPYMGTHWVDVKSPELNGAPFQATMIYGTYGGRLAFVEPMIDKAWLETRPDFRAPIKAGEDVEKPGYYPTEYTISYDERRDEYTVALKGFVWRKPAPAKATIKTAVAKKAAKPAARPR